MKAAGLDIGSRTLKLVVLDDAGKVISATVADTTPDVLGTCRRLLAAVEFDRMLVTGYGRGLAEVEFGAESVTEIKAHARGALATAPGCRSVLDIGGQDTKAIAMDAAGRVMRFEMNDRCAAGAGRFIEMMASALGYSLEEFGRAAMGGAETLTLSSMCAVFAESEVVGLMTRGRKREDIARAVHRAIAERAVGMLRRISSQPPVLFSGGGARDPCLAAMLEARIGQRPFVPPDPQVVGALGAALIILGKSEGARP